MINKDRVRNLAKEFGWEELTELRDPYMMSFTKFINGSAVRLNVWVTGTVGSYLDHPKSGRTQLYRRNVDEKLMRKIFRNPRVHTAKGYQTRNRRP